MKTNRKDIELDILNKIETNGFINNSREFEDACVIITTRDFLKDSLMIESMMIGLNKNYDKTEKYINDFLSKNKGEYFRFFSVTEDSSSYNPEDIERYELYQISKSDIVGIVNGYITERMNLHEDDFGFLYFWEDYWR